MPHGPGPAGVRVAEAHYARIRGAPEIGRDEIEAHDDQEGEGGGDQGDESDADARDQAGPEHHRRPILGSRDVAEPEVEDEADELAHHEEGEHRGAHAHPAADDSDEGEGQAAEQPVAGRRPAIVDDIRAIRERIAAEVSLESILQGAHGAIG